MSKHLKKEKDLGKKEKSLEKILQLDESGLMIPVKWRLPNALKNKDYLAIILGGDQRYGLSRIFLEKQIIEHDNSLQIGFNPLYFSDNLIIEEKFSCKKNKTQYTQLSYYQISIFEDCIWGEKLTKETIETKLFDKQELILERIKELFEIYGEDFILFIMTNILKEKRFSRKLKGDSFKNIRY